MEARGPAREDIRCKDPEVARTAEVAGAQQGVRTEGRARPGHARLTGMGRTWNLTQEFWEVILLSWKNVRLWSDSI